MKTLVLGLGNPILSDDAIGIKVAHEIDKELNNPEITVAEAYEGGLSLLDLIVGYDQVIIVDAIQTQNGKVGQIYRLEPADFSFSKHTSSPHTTNLATALELGRMISLAIPQKITIFAIEVSDVSTFSEECTCEVENIIPEAARLILSELNTNYLPLEGRV